jgi:uncharacterized membrane protein YqjE
MTSKDPKTPAQGLGPAFEKLAEGVSTLVREHLELARLEMREDAGQAAKSIAILILCGSVAFVGYLMLNVAGVALGAVLYGKVGLAAAAFLLAVLNFLVSFILIKSISSESEAGLLSFEETTRELSRDKEWLRQIGERTTEQEKPAELS